MKTEFYVNIFDDKYNYIKPKRIEIVNNIEDPNHMNSEMFNNNNLN
jgi:hypothetical protein